MQLADIKEKLDARPKFDKISRRTKRNSTIAEYYEDMAVEIEENRLPWLFESATLLNIADRMRKCCRYWDIDHYPFQGVKDLLRTNACKNRFCDNCQNAVSKQRDRKYAPMLNDLARSQDIYHIVFTVPNVYGDELKPCVDNIYKQFAYINRLFSGDAKIKGINFYQYGYIGAVRALEITKNRAEGTFHPHLHCLFILRKGLDLDKNRWHINKFSFNNPDIKKSHHKNYSEKKRKFSDFEILLQKIWRLRIDGIKLTKKNIEELGEGYSVICDNAQGKYKEVFKYATKGIFKEGEEHALCGYYDFLPLFNTLYKRRLIQGYKILRHCDFEEDIDQSADKAYKEVKTTLNELDKPIREFEFLNEIEKNMEKKKYTYISRSTIAEIMGEDYEEEHPE